MRIDYTWKFTQVKNDKFGNVKNEDLRVNCKQVYMSKCKNEDLSANRNKCELDCHLGGLNPKMHFVAKQGLEEMRYLKNPIVEKMRNENRVEGQTWPYT